MVTSDVGSFKLVLNWIENVWKDLSKTIQCDGNQTNVVTGQGSCSDNVGVTKNAAEGIHDLVDNYPKDHLP